MRTDETMKTLPGSLLGSLRAHWGLITQMTRREITGRYRGSVLGLAWSFFHPVVMLLVYTFVFSVVFRARWGGGEQDGLASFAIILFIGLIVFNIFAESVSKAPSLITNNANYVKKVVFPLEILPLVSIGSALFHALVSMGVLLLALLITEGRINASALFLPLVIAPLAIATLGICWVLASLGVFIRDVAQTIGLVVTVIQFLSPVFYSVKMLPEKYQSLLLLNPLTFVIEQARAVIIWGHMPDWQGLCLYTLTSVLIAIAGYWWFEKTREGFADVL